MFEWWLNIDQQQPHRESVSMPKTAAARRRSVASREFGIASGTRM